MYFQILITNFSPLFLPYFDIATVDVVEEEKIKQKSVLIISDNSLKIICYINLLPKISYLNAL